MFFSKYCKTASHTNEAVFSLVSYGAYDVYLS